MKQEQHGASSRSFWVTSILLIAGFAVSAFAQSAGSIMGTVKDANGSAIAGATVSLVNSASSVAHTVTTNEDGIFVSPQLPPGAYVIKVEKSGFKKVEKTNVILTTGDKLN